MTRGSPDADCTVPNGRSVGSIGVLWGQVKRWRVGGGWVEGVMKSVGEEREGVERQTHHGGVTGKIHTSAREPQMDNM